MFGAKDEIRTRDPDLGKVVLYQLSYFRIAFLELQMYTSFKILRKFFEIFFDKKLTTLIYYFPVPSSFLISCNLSKASTGVKVSIFVFKISSFICKSSGSSN